MSDYAPSYSAIASAIRYASRISGKLMRPVLPAPRLSEAQRASRAASLTHAVGGAVGIFVGCVLGSFPLLFYEEPDAGDDDAAPSGPGAAAA